MEDKDVLRILGKLSEKVLELDYAFCEEDSEIPDTDKLILKIVEEIEEILKEVKDFYKNV